MSFPTAIGNPLTRCMDPRIPPEAGEASLSTMVF